MYAATHNAPARPADAHDARRAAAAADDLDARLNWLVAFHAYDDHRRRLFRDAREEREMSLMRRPVPTERAYKRLGLLLGALPPAAIFLMMFGGLIKQNLNRSPASAFALLFVCVLMNLICCAVGRWLGGKVGRRVDDLERGSWHRMIATTVLLGLLWGLMTGGMGGVIFFGVGAFFGAFSAVLVGVPAFLLFTLLHRPLARGGMIDARHFWPLACGITFTTAALILGH